MNGINLSNKLIYQQFLRWSRCTKKAI